MVSMLDIEGMPRKASCVVRDIQDLPEAITVGTVEVVEEEPEMCQLGTR